MKFEPRKYQTECTEAWFTALKEGRKSVIAVPTGAGKSVILAELIMKWITAFPESNVLVLSHTQEIIKQDYQALLEYFPSFGVGVFMAGLGLKQNRKITVAGINSVYKLKRFSKVDLVLIDEAHSINHKDSGMYRTFLNKLNATIGGMTATIYRTGHGYIHKGKDALFDDLAYDLTSLDAFNGLVKDGYLTKLISKATNLELDSSEVKKTGADYNIKQLSETHDRDYITEEAIKEVIKYGKNYNKWLIFAIDIDHATHIREELERNCIQCDELHTRMTKERDTVIDDFKNGSTRAIVSVGMVTTGFDSPNIDLIVLLRPTLSTVLHVQMVGRGLRVSPGKTHCLVLDFAGNTKRLGPVNNPVIPRKAGEGKATGGAPTKECPKCKVLLASAAMECDVCGYKYPKRCGISSTSGSDDIVAESKFRWVDVLDVRYNIHVKPGKPDSLKVTYCHENGIVSEWVCLNHSGYAKAKADNWVQYRDPTCTLFNTEHVYLRRDKLNVPTRIKVKIGEFLEIVDAEFSHNIKPIQRFTDPEI
jgi:DNA repair protein RadD